MRDENEPEDNARIVSTVFLEGDTPQKLDAVEPRPMSSISQKGSPQQENVQGKAAHRRSVSFPENADDLVRTIAAGDHAPVKKSKKPLKFPSIGSLFQTKSSSKSARESRHSDEQPTSSSPSPNSSAKHLDDQSTDSSQNNSRKKLDLFFSEFGDSFKKDPQKSSAPKKSTRSKSKRRSSASRPNASKSIFPWKQKKVTSVEEIEDVFDAGDHKRDPGTSSSSTVRMIDTANLQDRADAEDVIAHLRDMNLRRDRPLRKSLSLGSLDVFGRAHAHPPGLEKSKTMTGLIQPNGSVKNTGRLHFLKYKGMRFLNNYALMLTLGRGSFGKVVLALNTYDSELYALKLIPKNHRSRRMGSSANSANIQQEIDVMTALSHPNVVRLIEVIDDPQHSKMLLVMQFVEGRNLHPNQTRHLNTCNELIARRYFRDVLQGLDYLHANNIAHGDLKPENLLTNANGRVVIADLGSSQFTHGLSKTTRGTPAFTAPEMCQQHSYDPMKADVWALGVTLYVIVFGDQPFKADGMGALYDAICNDELQFPKQTYISDSLKHLLRRLIEKDPEKRISLIATMDHHWVTHNGAFPMENVRGLKPDEPPSEDAMMMECWPMDPVNFSFRSLIQFDLDLLESRRYKKGEILVRQGEPLQAILYIKKGEVEIATTFDEDGSDGSDCELEESLYQQDPSRLVASRSQSTLLKHVFHATRLAHQLIPSPSIKRVDLEESHELPVFTVTRGEESLLIEAEIMEKGLQTIWKSTITALQDTDVVVINLGRLRQYILRHPDLELDIRASITQRVRELQRLVVLEALSHVHGEIEDEIYTNGVCPLWTRASDRPEF